MISLIFTLVIISAVVVFYLYMASKIYQAGFEDGIAEQKKNTIYFKNNK